MKYNYVKYVGNTHHGAQMALRHALDKNKYDEICAVSGLSQEVLDLFAYSGKIRPGNYRKIKMLWSLGFINRVTNTRVRPVKSGA